MNHNIDVRIHSILLDGPVLAHASATLDGCFAVRGIKVINGTNGPFVSMPSYPTKEGYKDLCFPCTKDFKREFDQTVLGAYQQQLTQLAQTAIEEAPAPGWGDMTM